MIKLTNKKFIVGLEIGTTKVTVLVGEKLKNKEVKILGIGCCPSQGIDKGNIHDLESMVKCIKKSISQAEKTSNHKICSVNLSFSNKFIKYKNEIGMVSINTGEVSQEDIKNVIKTAKSVRINDKYHILHVIPQEYIIDEQKGIKNPLGLSGMRMQTKVHLITSYYNIDRNVVQAIKKCNLDVNKIIFSGLASSQSVLTEEEKQLGVCMLDVGGGTIDLLIYINGSLQYSKVIPYAGNIITKDISYAFSISMSDAEYLKIKYGCASSFLQENLQKIEIKNSENNQSQYFNQEKLIEVIELRCLELLEIVNKKIIKLQKKFKKNNSRYNLNAGIVITGGVSKTKFFIDCAERVFQTKVRIGYIKNGINFKNDINQPEYSTVIGLLHFKNKRHTLENNFLYAKTKKNWLYHIKNFFKL